LLRKAKRTIMRSRYFPFVAGLCLAVVVPAQAVLFTANSTIGAGDTNYDGEDIVVVGCTVTINGAHSFADVLVLEDGTITEGGQTTNAGEGLTLSVSDNVIVEGGSSIVADAAGYGPGLGEGAGRSAITDSPYGFNVTSGGGGGYGGNGATSFAGAAGGGGLWFFPGSR
jgi:hypothetical protein